MQEISTNTFKLLKQVKKEHFLKLSLQISTLVLFLFLAFMIIFAITPLSTTLLKDIPKPLYEIVLDDKGNIIEAILAQTIQQKDINALYVFNGNNNNIVLLLSLIGGSGWLMLLTYITIQKNMITPQAIKKTVRKALQFNYLKQKDVDYVVNEIDINIGIKKRERNEKEE